MEELLGGFEGAALSSGYASQPREVLDALVVKMHHQAPAGFEVAVDAPQAIELLLRSDQIHERVAGNDGQTKRFTLVKRAHVGLSQPDVLDAVALLPGHLQHLLGEIKSDDLSPIPGQADGNSSCPAGDVEQALPFAPHVGSETLVELDFTGPIRD